MVAKPSVSAAVPARGNSFQISNFELLVSAIKLLETVKLLSLLPTPDISHKLCSFIGHAYQPPLVNACALSSV